jgi:hypothetical protein
MMHEQGTVTVDTNVYIQGIITLTPELSNIPDFVAYILDTTALPDSREELSNSRFMTSSMNIRSWNTAICGSVSPPLTS